jgi:cell division protease FtsH
VTVFGMSSLGPLALENMENDPYTGRGGDYSEEIAIKIDVQIRDIAKQCYIEAQRIIRENRTLVDQLADALLEQETLEGDEFRAIIAAFRKETEQVAAAVMVN